jgi:hypothetical protein
MEEKDLIWLAGFTDGEGYIGITTKGKNSYGDNKYQLIFRICNTHSSTMDYIAKILNTKKNDIFRYNDIWKDQYGVALFDSMAEKIIEKLLPYVITKKKQCEVALLFRKTIMVGRNQHDNFIDYEDRKALQYKYYLDIKKLNKRGK